MNAQYSKYLVPETKEAFLAGMNAMTDIISTASPDDLAFFTSRRDADHMIAMLLRQESYNSQLQRECAANIIRHSDLPKADLRAFVFGFTINDAGYATNADGYVIEDNTYALMPDYQREPWPYVLACHKQTGAQISREEYDNLSPEQQENYDLRRYLDLKDEHGILLKRVIEDNEAYMAMLISADLSENKEDTIVYRYLSECGTGHGTLPRGRFYEYRQLIARLAADGEEHVRGISPMITAQIEKGYITSLGQYYLALLQSLTRTLKPSTLANMDVFQLADLKFLLTLTGDDLGYYISDNDIMYFRDVNGDGLKGLIPTDQGNGWKVIRASDEHCDLWNQKTYVVEQLIPKAADRVIEAFFCLEEYDNIPCSKLAVLAELIETIDPNIFENEGCDDCDGCNGCPKKVHADNPDAATTSMPGTEAAPQE